MRQSRLLAAAASAISFALLTAASANAQPQAFPPHPLWPDQGEAKPEPCEMKFPPGVDASLWNTNLWPGGQVPYVIDPGVTQQNRDRLRIAMDELQTNCNVNFVVRTTQPNYIYVQNGTGNNSFVGQIGGSQTINLVSWSSRYTIIHELMHALGVWHEQSRADRDTYVIINQANIQPAFFNGNFTIQGGAAPTGEYDFESIMHYDECAFSTCCPAGSICACPSNCRAINVRPGYEQFATVMGNSSFLSAGDKAGLVSRYGQDMNDPYEDNDSLANAAPIQVGVTSGLNLFDTADYFSVELPTPGPLSVTFSAAGVWSISGNVTIAMLAPNGTVLASKAIVSASDAGSASLSASFSTGSALIRVTRVQPWGGYYTLAVTAACTPTPWKPAVTGTSPSERNEHALAFDSARGVAVLFGGNISSGPLINDTWEWNGSSWTRASTVGPSPRKNTMMAYDAARGVVVLFGGFDSSGVRGDTWEWNGTAWVERTIAGPNPPARRTGSMCFDSARGKIVLHSGLSGAGTVLADTWEYNGAAWSLVASGGPPARYASAMAFDARPGRNVVVLFGGFFAGTYKNDTWEWNGASWTQRFPATSPSTREAATNMAYDTSRQRLVLFGGQDGSGDVATGCWEYDGTNWTLASTVTPLKRYGNAVAYDSTRSRIVSFGGAPNTNNIGTKYADTWSFDGTVWLPIAGPHPPRARGRCELIADTNAERVLLFGGGIATDNAAIRDFWVHKNSVWGQYDLPSEGAAIVGIHSYCSAFDSARNRAVLFGGVNQFTGALSSNTWELGPSGWNQSPPATVPAARDRAAMVYDAARNKCVMFGGSTGPTFPSETWTYDGTNWSIATSVGPDSRYHHAMAYDPVRQRTVCFGGILGPSQQLTDDTWEFDGTQWARIIPPGSPGAPSARFGHRLAYDAERGAVVLFGGSNFANEFDSRSWAWNGTAWERIVEGQPEGRNMFGFAPEPGAGRLVMFGGIRVTQTNSDTWRFDSIADPPTFTSQPQNATVDVETHAQFNAPATDVGNFTYRWFATTNNDGVQGSIALNDLDRGGRIFGVFTSQLRINSAQTSDATSQPVPGVFVNQYFCVVTNACQPATSNPATLTVNTPPPTCVGDLTGDGVVNVVDLTIFLGAFGTSVPPGTGADLDANGVVNVIDLTIFLGRFGQTCP